MGKNPTRKIDGALVGYHKELFLVGNATRAHDPEFQMFIDRNGSHYNSSLFCHESLVSSHVPRLDLSRGLPVLMSEYDDTFEKLAVPSLRHTSSTYWLLLCTSRYY